MLSNFRTRQAARLGLAALTFALGVVTPLAPTSLVLAQSSGGGNSSCSDPGPPDYPVAAGWFYTQQGRGCIIGVGPARRRGYLVQDDAQGAFWTEFRRYGGLDVLGYPVSQRFNYPATIPGGYLYQAFERGILQWHPETGRADMANVFEQFSEQGLDPQLEALGIPRPEAADTSCQLRRGRRTSHGLAVRAALPRTLLLRPRCAAFERAAATRSGRVRDARTSLGLLWPAAEPARAAVSDERHLPEPGVTGSARAYLHRPALPEGWPAALPARLAQTRRSRPVAGLAIRRTCSIRRSCQATESRAAWRSPRSAFWLEPSAPTRSFRPRLSSLFRWTPRRCRSCRRSYHRLALVSSCCSSSFRAVRSRPVSRLPSISPTRERLRPVHAAAASDQATWPPPIPDGSWDQVLTARVGTYELLATGDVSGKKFDGIVDLTSPYGGGHVQLVDHLPRRRPADRRR